MHVPVIWIKTERTKRSHLSHAFGHDVARDDRSAPEPGQQGPTPEELPVCVEERTNSIDRCERSAERQRQVDPNAEFGAPSEEALLLRQRRSGSP